MTYYECEVIGCARAGACLIPGRAKLVRLVTSLRHDGSLDMGGETASEQIRVCPGHEHDHALGLPLRLAHA